MALGLFAIFALLRFRTTNLAFKTMSYLFTVIGVSVGNALYNPINPWRGPVIVNGLIILSVFLLERFYQKTTFSSHVLMYSRLELLDPDKMEELLSDISTRLNRRIAKIEIRKIDLNKGNAELEVFYRDTPVQTSRVH